MIKWQSGLRMMHETKKMVLPKRNKHEIVFEQFGHNEPDFDNGSINIFFHLRKQSVVYNFKNNNLVQKTITSEISINFIVIVPDYE